jgi:hypothetical protein
MQSRMKSQLVYPPQSERLTGASPLRSLKIRNPQSTIRNPWEPVRKTNAHAVSTAQLHF